MLHIDEDEFVSIPHACTTPSRRRQRKARKGRKERDSALFAFAESFFSAHPSIAALSLSPMLMHSCPSRHPRSGEVNQSNQVRSGLLPRVDRWNYGSFSDFSPHNGKLIMRTDAVRMFFAHYLIEMMNSSLGGSLRGESVTWKIPPPLALLLHYKKPGFLSGNIFGEVLPFRRRKVVIDGGKVVEEARECATAMDMRGNGTISKFSLRVHCLRKLHQEYSHWMKIHN
jgi:hypothetical protein